MAAGEHALLPRELRWMRRVIDHPVSHAIVYSFCVGLWMLHAGARLADAGNSAAYVSLCTLLLSPVAMYLFGLRTAIAAMESDKAPAPKPPRQSREIFWAVFVHLVKDFKLVSWLLFMFAIAGL